MRAVSESNKCPGASTVVLGINDDLMTQESHQPNRMRDACLGSYRSATISEFVNLKEATNSTTGDRTSRSGRQLAPISADKVPGWKFVLDHAVILLSFPIWLPLMMLVMLIVRIGSRGPIFYRQERIGLGGRRFSLWKFRTMKMNAETETHERYLKELMENQKPMTKLDLGDPRLVRFGRMLRASGLDELPQVFNVLRGEMSLVGPRPCLPNEFACFQPWQQQRVEALPGLTGYWQVNGKNRTTFNQMVAMDLFYLNNMSILLDLKIMLMTSMTVVAQVLQTYTSAERDKPVE